MTRKTNTLTRVLGLVLLTAWAGLAGGCDGAGWLSFNIVIPLGLTGDTGLFNPTGDGSLLFPPPASTDFDPPPPIQVGDPTTGGTTGTTGTSPTGTSN